MLKREDNNPEHLTFPQASTNVNSLVLTTFWESLATVVSKSLEKMETLLTTVQDAQMGKEPGALLGCLARGQECLRLCHKWGQHFPKFLRNRKEDEEEDSFQL